MSDLNKSKTSKILDGRKTLMDLELELEQKNKTLNKLIKSKQDQLQNLKQEIESLNTQEQQSQKEYQKIMVELKNLKNQISACQEKITSVNTQITNEQNDEHFNESLELLKMNIEDILSRNYKKKIKYLENINNFFFCLQQQLITFSKKKYKESHKSKNRCFCW